MICLKRNATQALINWKNSEDRKPMVLKGAGPKQTVAEQEERSSILAKLKAPVETTNRTEKHAPKRSAEKEL